MMPPGLAGKLVGCKLHQGKEVAWIPPAAEYELVRPFLAAHVPAAANMTEVVSWVGMTEKTFGQGFVRMRHANGLHTLCPGGA